MFLSQGWNCCSNYVEENIYSIRLDIAGIAGTNDVVSDAIGGWFEMNLVTELWSQLQYVQQIPE